MDPETRLEAEEVKAEAGLTNKKSPLKSSSSHVKDFILIISRCL